jgi:TetR/AcrR family transcriptional regulator, mexJK operon transcriptional repressor
METLVVTSRTAGRPRTADLEARQQDLVRVAGELFLEHGYGGTSLEMIAKAAHVAVRTIYVKFGGKAGLFNAVLKASRERFFPGTGGTIEDDPRPLREAVIEFGRRFSRLVNTPEARRLHRMVIAEAGSNQELAQTFYEASPKLTRDKLIRYFSRPDIAEQLRPGLDPAVVAVALVQACSGDALLGFLFEREPEPESALLGRLDLFFHAVLLAP